MALTLEDQFNAAAQPLLVHRVNQATYNAAVTAFSDTTPPTAPNTQAQRNELVSALLQDKTFGEEIFVNFIVGDSSLTTTNDITDTLIAGKLTQDVFDNVARILFPDAGT